LVAHWLTVQMWSIVKLSPTSWKKVKPSCQKRVNNCSPRRTGDVNKVKHNEPKSNHFNQDTYLMASMSVSCVHAAQLDVLHTGGKVLRITRYVLSFTAFVLCAVHTQLFIQFLGPAALLHAHRWISDSRDDFETERFVVTTHINWNLVLFRWIFGVQADGTEQSRFKALWMPPNHELCCGNSTISSITPKGCGVHFCSIRFVQRLSTQAFQYPS